MLSFLPRECRRLIFRFVQNQPFPMDPKAFASQVDELAARSALLQAKYEEIKGGGDDGRSRTSS